MYQVTYVIGVTDPIERIACVGKVLKTQCQIDESWLRAHPEAPSLESAGIRSSRNRSDTDLWHDVPAILRLKQATEPEMLCALAARACSQTEPAAHRSAAQDDRRRTDSVHVVHRSLRRRSRGATSRTSCSHTCLLVSLEINALCLTRHPRVARCIRRASSLRRGAARAGRLGRHSDAGRSWSSRLLPEGTLLLRDDFELVPIEDLCVGDRIGDNDKWTTVRGSS